MRRLVQSLLRERMVMKEMNINCWLPFCMSAINMMVFVMVVSF